MKYNAFISYRHTELDMEIAKKLHKGLETFRIPQLVRERYGKRKIDRVFRDQEELPIGSDLDNNILAALSDSEFLIVICSPRTPQSEWVIKEIESFISLRDRDHILAILIEGEPEESFPPQLLTDGKGNQVEPLAADIRGKNAAERNRKFKTELMRLAAPLIGCTYDELRQRNRERVMRRNMTIAGAIGAVAAILGISFGVYNAKVAAQMKELADDKALLAEKSASLAAEKAQLADDILLQYQETKKNQSRFYAEESLKLLSEGRREEAILVARAGLPSVSEDRPYVPELEFALSQALHAYDDGNTPDFDRLLHHEQVVSEMEISSDENYIISVDTDSNVYLWDTESWELIVEIPFRQEEDGWSFDKVVAVDADDSYLYIARQTSLIIYDHAGNEVRNLPLDEYLIGGWIESVDRYAFLATSDCVWCIDLDTGDFLQTVEKEGNRKFGPKGTYIGNGLLAITYTSEEGEKNGLSVIDAGEGLVKRIPLASESVLRIIASPDGHIALAECNADYYITGIVNEIVLEWVDPLNGVLWSRDTGADVKSGLTLYTVLKIQSIAKDEGTENRIILTADDGVYCWDTESGEELVRFKLPDQVNSLLVSSLGDYAIVGYSSGTLDWINTKEGGKVGDKSYFESGLNLRQLIFYGDNRLLRVYASQDIYLLSVHKSVGLEELAELEEGQIPAAVAPDGSYFVTYSGADARIVNFFDPEGNLIYSSTCESFPDTLGFLNGKAVIATMGGVCYVDPMAKTEEFVDYPKLGGEIKYTNCGISEDSHYLAAWIGSSMAVFDLEKRSRLYGKDMEKSVYDVALANNGTALVGRANTPLLKLDVNTGKTEEYADKGLMGYNSSGSHYLFISPSGEKAIMFADFSSMYVLDVENMEVIDKIPIAAKIRKFASFNEDESIIVFQGDDFSLHIWDLEERAYINRMKDFNELYYVTWDTAEGKLILVDQQSVHILETETWARIAYAPDGIAYSVKEEMFIQEVGNKLYRSRYLDYRKLLEEAERQLPGRELTDQQKREYNIE
ncbi:MAG: TIR domain-containing protein [Lachnospiraceae bacterium]|nr:TIR domain-containing protein [Lachnospiraceae bacterium]